MTSPAEWWSNRTGMIILCFNYWNPECTSTLLSVNSTDHTETHFAHPLVVGRFHISTRHRSCVTKPAGWSTLLSQIAQNTQKPIFTPDCGGLFHISARHRSCVTKPAGWSTLFLQMAHRTHRSPFAHPTTVGWFHITILSHYQIPFQIFKFSNFLSLVIFTLKHFLH